MGVSYSGIAIKTNKAHFDADHFVKTVFSLAAIRTDKHYDIREKNKLAIVKTSDGYIWIDGSLAGDNVLHKGDSTYLSKISEYFDKPESMIVLNEYDSGGTYGYGIVENGQLIRWRVTLSVFKTIENGPLLDLEKEWLESESFVAEYDEDEDAYIKLDRTVLKEELQDDDYLRICRVNQSTGEILPEDEVSIRLHEKVMQTYFGYTMWDRMDKVAERIGYYL